MSREKNSPLVWFQQAERKHHHQYQKFKKQNLYFGLLRFLLAIICIISIYAWQVAGDPGWLLPGLVFLVAFIFAVRKHQSIQRNQILEHTLTKINENEIEFVENNYYPFESGDSFIDATHYYSYDLDLFGDHSLFQYLNRTATYMGAAQLAKKMLASPVTENIQSTQHALEELKEGPAWRQRLLAIARVQQDSKESYQQLLDWVATPPSKINRLISVYSYAAPVVTLLLIALYFFYPEGNYINYLFLSFLVNLAVLGTMISTIKAEDQQSTEVDKELKQYASVIAHIEGYSFHSAKLQELQNRFDRNGAKASHCVHQLSALFTSLDHINNIFAAPLLNGLGLFHIHILRKLNNWKKANKDHLATWLETLGEFEALNSLANFSFNNPSFSFPKINQEKKIILKNTGHPLINPAKRITNDITFQEDKFFVLTGSNMSGKSTFLRSLGINMILTNMGSVVCASSASVHPMDIYVSMRMADSLSDSESYFFAEVKRLRSIITALNEKTAFVLLDEILRGTNSDDKRTGTIEVIKKLHEFDAIGIIATHDLEVCNVSDQLVGVANKRFEVAIKNDELQFDYKLLDGVCENKSATFLMKKMGVIS